jgi:hypothetical protein
MVIINKNANSYLRLSLAEKSTLTTPYYLFVFTNDLTKQEKIFTQFDSSSYPYRYNEFLITDSTSENLSSGVINFNPTGFWSYKVYEMEDSTNLLVANCTSLVEEGRAEVIGTATEFKKYQSSRTYRAYGKGST